jgi:hypothetical protein
MQRILGKTSLGSVADLLKPYQTENKGIPDFPFSKLMPNEPGGDTNPEQRRGDRPLPKAKGWDLQPHLVLPVLATVSGRVLDERGKPVAGAVVSLTASSISYAQPQLRMTLDDGSYSFEDVPGSYFISARLGSSIPGGELNSESQTVTLKTASPSNVNLYIQPPVRAQVEEEVGAEQRSLIIDFIAAADHAEERAAYKGDPRYLEEFYAGEALQVTRNGFDESWNEGMVPSLYSGQVKRMRYFPQRFTIEVDTVEVWSHTWFSLRTGNKLRTSYGKETAQTITIRQTPQGWYIINIQFSDAH